MQGIAERLNFQFGFAFAGQFSFLLFPLGRRIIPGYMMNLHLNRMMLILCAGRGARGVGWAIRIKRSKSRKMSQGIGHLHNKHELDSKALGAA